MHTPYTLDVGILPLRKGEVNMWDVKIITFVIKFRSQTKVQFRSMCEAEESVSVIQRVIRGTKVIVVIKE